MTTKSFKDFFPKKDSKKPEYTAVGLVRMENGWSVVTLKMRGEQVLESEVSEPDLKLIAKEAFKINVTKKVFSE